jgi:hypothetical protein
MAYKKNRLSRAVTGVTQNLGHAVVFSRIARKL